MANQTFGSFCSGCGLNHSTADCPWKPAVSGVYEKCSPHVTTGVGCSRCGGPHSTAFCTFVNEIDKGFCEANPAVFKPGPIIYTPDTVTTPVNPWDNQVGGQHYKKGIQPFEYAMANNLSSLEFSVVKYLRKKGDKAKRLEDLNKAKDCLEKLIWWEEHDGKI